MEKYFQIAAMIILIMRAVISVMQRERRQVTKWPRNEFLSRNKNYSAGKAEV